jgi:hypothetical protein
MNELRGGAPRGLPSNERAPRGRAVKPTINPGVGGVPLDKGLKLPAVVVNVRPSFRAARDLVRLARSLNVDTRPVGNPVAPDGGFRAADGRAVETDAAATVGYHDAYEFVGPKVALARLCGHPAVCSVRGWTLPLSVRPGPVAAGAGPMPEPVVKRLREARAERIRYAEDTAMDRELSRRMGEHYEPVRKDTPERQTFRQWREKLAQSRAGKPRVEDTAAGAEA